MQWGPDACARELRPKGRTLACHPGCTRAPHTRQNTRKPPIQLHFLHPPSQEQPEPTRIRGENPRSCPRSGTHSARASGRPADLKKAWSEARDVPAAAHGLALEGIDRIVDPPADLGDPREPIAEDPFNSALERGRTDRARTARTLKLDLDHPCPDIGKDEIEIATVSLNGRPHELDQPGQVAHSLRSLVVRQRRRVSSGAEGRSLFVIGGLRIRSSGLAALCPHRMPLFGPAPRLAQPTSILPYPSPPPNVSARPLEIAAPRFRRRTFRGEADRDAEPSLRIPCLVLMERSGHSPGAIGLILPTFPQGADLPESGASRLQGSSLSSPNPDAGFPSLEEITGICSDAEQLGAGALWVTDHLFWHGSALEAFTALTVAATATRSCALGTCVLQLPLRQPAAVAKQAAALQSISGGRIIIGVGVGDHAGEFEQVGVDFGTRGRQLDIGISDLRRCWKTSRAPEGDVGASTAARYRQLPEVAPIPVWIGGSSEAALRRAASVGDGWIPFFLGAVEYAEALERLAKEAEGADRSAAEVTPATVLFVSIDDDVHRALARGTRWMSSLYRIPAKAFARHLVYGTASDVAKVVTNFWSAGAEHVAIYVTANEPLEQFDRLIAALPSLWCIQG